MPEDVTAIDLWVEGAVVVPYPTALSSEIDTKVLLATAGVAVDDTDKIFVTEVEGEGAVSYTLRLSAESTKVVEEWQRKGIDVCFRSPLMSCVVRAIAGSRRPKTVVLSLLGDTAYVALSNEKRLQYAEAMPMGGEEELINLLALLNEDYDLRKARFILLGKESATYRKTLRQYFRRVRVES